MTGNYYAITRLEAEWLYVCSGAEPAHVYRDACDLLQRTAWPDDEPAALSPATERLLDNLRVVPAAIAREQYHVRFRTVESLSGE